MNKTLSTTQKVLNVWAIILIIWSFYRVAFTNAAWFDEFVAKPAIFILPIYYFIKKREKADFFNQIGLTNKNLLEDIIYGLIIGSVLIIVAFLVHGSKGINMPLLGRLLPLLFLSLATALSEEILSIGFVFKRLYNESKNILSSIFNCGVLFLILHIPILLKAEKLNGPRLLMFFYLNFVLIVINSIIFLRRSSLTLPILIHTFYNLSILLFL